MVLYKLQSNLPWLWSSYICSMIFLRTRVRFHCLLFHWLTFPPDSDAVIPPNAPYAYDHFGWHHCPKQCLDFYRLPFIHSTNIIFPCRDTALGTCLSLLNCRKKIPQTGWLKPQEDSSRGREVPQVPGHLTSKASIEGPLTCWNRGEDITLWNQRGSPNDLSHLQDFLLFSGRTAHVHSWIAPWSSPIGPRKPDSLP